MLHTLSDVGWIRRQFADRLRDAIGKVNDRSEDASKRLIKQMLALKYVMGMPLFGPIVRPMFETPELVPIRVLADVIGCIELKLQGKEGGAIDLGMILYNRTSGEVADVLSATSTNLTSVVDRTEAILENIAEPSYDHSAQLSAISDELRTIIVQIIERARALLGPNSTCLIGIVGLDRYVPYGGSKARLTTANRILWKGKEHVVRTDRDGGRYIMAQRARVYLATIRGQYRYKKD